MVLAVTLHNLPEGMALGVVLAGFLAGDPTITLASGDTFEKAQEGVLVAQVGETKYTSIDEALTAALSAEDHTLTLLQDVTKDISIAAGSTLTIEAAARPCTVPSTVWQLRANMPTRPTRTSP